MARCGPTSLTETELLAIVLRTGSGSSSALDLARDLLMHAGSLNGVAKMSVGELVRVKGIGTTKALELQAVFELGRRRGVSDQFISPVVHSPEDVAHRMVPRLSDLQQEVFIVLSLDGKNAVRRETELSRGTLNASIVHPREVFKIAIDDRAAAIIVVHNHPSGNPQPSSEDIEITRQLAETGQVVGIPVRDHIIIAGSRYTSLAELGFL
jgi:DNA repair protein RadC